MATTSSTRLGQNRALVALVPLLLLGFTSSPAAAQPASAPGLGTLALNWARGHFATPLVCEIDGRPVRGLRRVLIEPVSKRLGHPAAQITFVDLEPGAAKRCFNDFGQPEPNLVGSLEIRHLGSHHPESARRDFKEALRRKQGFEFAITSGHLRLQEVQQPPAPTEIVDFARGRAKLRLIAPGSDAARRLADFRSPRKLLLDLQTRDGRQLSFPLVLRELR
jgi:hypothetical protein